MAAQESTAITSRSRWCECRSVCSLPHPSTVPAAVRRAESVEYVNRTLAVGAAMAPVSIIFFGPQNCGAVAQTLPAKGRLQDDPRLFGYF